MASSSDFSRIGLALAIFHICLMMDLVLAGPMIHLSVHLQTELFDRCSRAEEPTSDMLRHQLVKIQHHPNRQCLRRVSLISDLHLHDIQPTFLRNCPTSRSDQEASEEFRARTEAPWYIEVYQVDTSHPQAKPMFPFDIKTAKCCPGRRCYMSFTNTNGGRGFEEGIPSELKYDEIVLQQTSKCYRQPGSITLYKYYEPVIVELSRSCHCTFPPPNQQVIASTPQPDGCN